jgi:hypothetical protein
MVTHMAWTTVVTATMILRNQSRKPLAGFKDS